MAAGVEEGAGRGCATMIRRAPDASNAVSARDYCAACLVGVAAAGSRAMTVTASAALAALAALAAILQMTTACKSCIAMSKEEREMFRSHSEACAAQSHLDAGSPLLQSLYAGEVVDDPALRTHVYCVLQRCKVVGKDGKLLKSAVLGKIGSRDGGKNATKILENCSAEQTGDTPEDLAWNLFRCGYEKKAVLFHHMSAGGATRELDNNSN